MGAQFPERIGSYRLLSVLGAGGMGAVYRATHLQTGAIVALKTVERSNRASLHAIRQEVHGLSRLSHPGIARILDSGTEQGVPWYAMELIAGQTLEAVRDELWRPASDSAADASTGMGQGHETTHHAGAAQSTAQALPIDNTLPGVNPEQAPAPPSARLTEVAAPILTRLDDIFCVIRRLCAPLSYLHGEGFVHRDLKPANILVRPSGEVVLVDFGLLTAFIGGASSRDSLAMHAPIGGTLAYVAPEQIRGERTDARADLYALGCIFYELLTGAPPFTDSDANALIRAHLHTPPLRPSLRIPGLPLYLDELLLRLLAKDPRQRLGYAVDLAASLSPPSRFESRPSDLPPSRCYLYRPALAGREQTLEVLKQACTARIEQSQGGAVFLIGESGIGKTRLAMEAARWVENWGGLVLSGECDPLSGTQTSQGRGLQALARPLQALVDRCQARGLQHSEYIFGPRGKLLSSYQPAIADLPGQQRYAEAPLPAEAARSLVARSLLATLAAVCTEQPLLLILDDLQWADDLTLAFVEQVARNESGAASRLCVLVTVRSEECSEAISGLLAQTAVTCLRVGRLEATGIADMAMDMLALPAVSPTFVDLLVRNTEGNPFFIAEYLRTAIDEGFLHRDAESSWIWRLDSEAEAQLSRVALPRSLGELVTRRLTRLSEDAQRLIEAAAVIGREIPLGLLYAASSGAPIPAAPDLAERLAPLMPSLSELRLREVVQDAAADKLRFAHDKFRESAYDQMAEPRRRALHRAVAEALFAQLPSHGSGQCDAAAIAHHYQKAGDAVQALPLWLAAAQQLYHRCDHPAAQHAYRQALRTLGGAETGLAENLLRRTALWQKPAEPGFTPVKTPAAALREARRTAHAGLGDVLRVIGRYEDALAEYNQAAALTSGEEAHAVLLAGIGATYFSQGALVLADEVLSSALARLGSPLPQSRLRELGSIGKNALLALLRGASGEPLQSSRARAMARLRVQILNRLAYINYSFGRLRFYQTHFVALAEAEQIASTAEAAETFSHHGPIMAGFTPGRALRQALRAVRICEEHQHVPMRMQAEFMAGICCAFQARFEQAAQHFHNTIALYPKLGDIHTLQTAQENLAYVQLYRGLHEEAVDAAQRAVSLCEQIDGRRGRANSLIYLGLGKLRLGQLEQAKQAAREAEKDLAALQDHVLTCMFHTLCARIELAQGEKERAEAGFTAAVRIATERRILQEEVVAAFTALAELTAESASTPLRALIPLIARTRFLALLFPAHRGGVLRAEARLLLRLGQLPLARQRFRQAVATLRSLGMEYEATQTEAALGAIENAPYGHE